MPSAVDISIIVSGLVGVSGVGASLFTVLRTTRAADRRADKSARQAIYLEFAKAERTMYALCLDRRAGNMAGHENLQAAITVAKLQAMALINPLMIAGGVSMAHEALEVIKKIAEYDKATDSGADVDDPDEPTLDAYNAATIKLGAMMSDDLRIRAAKRPKKSKVVAKQPVGRP